MSARIEIKDDGYSVVIKPKGKWQVRLFVNDTDSTTQKTIAAIRQQQTDIDALTKEVEQWKTACTFGGIARGVCEERDRLRAELAEIKAAQLNMVTRDEMESHGISEYNRGYRDGYG